MPQSATATVRTFRLTEKDRICFIALLTSYRAQALVDEDPDAVQQIDEQMEALICNWPACFEAVKGFLREL